VPKVSALSIFRRQDLSELLRGIAAWLSHYRRGMVVRRGALLIADFGFLIADFFQSAILSGFSTNPEKIQKTSCRNAKSAHNCQIREYSACFER
jgi:hypothetical protein